MGHRLSKIYTRTGDAGSTGLSDGSRVDKDCPRIEAIGAVDELNSLLGLLLCRELPAPAQALLTEVQHTLFDLGGALSAPGHAALDPAQVGQLEQALDALNAELAPLKEFVLPGGSEAAALCHVARSVCRRADRRLVHLQREAPLDVPAIAYLNRLSDYLFVLARTLNRLAGVGDVLWRHERERN